MKYLFLLIIVLAGCSKSPMTEDIKATGECVCRNFDGVDHFGYVALFSAGREWHVFCSKDRITRIDNKYCEKAKL